LASNRGQTNTKDNEMIEITVSNDVPVKIPGKAWDFDESCKELHFKRCRTNELPETTTGFIYAWVDMHSFDPIWKLTSIEQYLPRNVNDLIDETIYGTKEECEARWNYSCDKTMREEDKFATTRRAVIDAPILKSDTIAFENGMHRYHLCRAINATKFVAAIPVEIAETLIAHEIISHEKSYTLFDRHHNVIQENYCIELTLPFLKTSKRIRSRQRNA